jgi:murein DD-endopeptidase MepM/ murein hydrolase activator NlpD
MKKLIISETQYKRLVNNLITEEVIFQNPEDKSDQTPHMMDFLSNLSDTIRIASGKDLYVSKIEKSIIYLDKSKYTEEEKKVINDKSKKYFEIRKNPPKSFGTEELSFFFDYGESTDLADIKDRRPKLIDIEPIKNVYSNDDSNVASGLIYPTPGARGFGIVKDPGSGLPQVHNGHDYAVPQGTELYMIMKGTVTQSEIDTTNGCGGKLKIKMEDGTSSTFCHLLKRYKKVGDIVEPNELVALTGGQKGTVGQGYSYSPHIHYELEVGDKKVNPIPDAEKYWRIKK